MKYQCPKCKSTNLRVVVESWATLHQDDPDDPDNIQTDIGDSLAHEWNENSPMECSDCGHCEISLQFNSEPAPEADPGSNDPHCKHEWSSGLDESDHETRIYCLRCGADGDA